MTAAALQVWSLAQRSLVRTTRQPASVVGPFAFPLALLAVNSAGLRPSVRLPGFPTHSFLAFALAIPFMQGALFATMNAGTDLARDIQTGFLNRLALTPLRGAALVAGNLASVVAMGFVQAVVYLSVGLAVGVHLKSGVGGASPRSPLRSRWVCALTKPGTSAASPRSATSWPPEQPGSDSD